MIMMMMMMMQIVYVCDHKRIRRTQFFNSSDERKNTYLQRKSGKNLPTPCTELCPVPQVTDAAYYEETSFLVEPQSLNCGQR